MSVLMNNNTYMKYNYIMQYRLVRIQTFIYLQLPFIKDKRKNMFLFFRNQIQKGSHTYAFSGLVGADQNMNQMYINYY